MWNESLVQCAEDKEKLLISYIHIRVPDQRRKPAFPASCAIVIGRI